MAPLHVMHVCEFILELFVFAELAFAGKRFVQKQFVWRRPIVLGQNVDRLHSVIAAGNLYNKVGRIVKLRTMQTEFGQVREQQFGRSIVDTATVVGEHVDLVKDLQYTSGRLVDRADNSRRLVGGVAADLSKFGQFLEQLNGRCSAGTVQTAGRLCGATEAKKMEMSKKRFNGLKFLELKLGEFKQRPTSSSSKMSGPLMSSVAKLSLFSCPPEILFDGMFAHLSRPSSLSIDFTRRGW